MKLIQNRAILFTIFVVILSITTPEIEARRLVLRGRRTITRHYYRGLAVPAWAIIVLCSLGNLGIGVILYFVLRKVVLKSTETETANSYVPAMVDDV